MGDMTEGEVLWIDPDLWRLPHRPAGFAFRVVHLLGWGDPVAHLVWVRGAVLDERGVPGDLLHLCVPVDQPRAVRRPPPGAGRPAPPPLPPPGDDGLQGPPPGYRRTR